jgi:hypothetical protein
VEVAFADGVAGSVERLVEVGDMEKGFATLLHKSSECISPSSAKGFQPPSPYMDALHHAGVDCFRRSAIFMDPRSFRNEGNIALGGIKIGVYVPGLVVVRTRP